MVRDPADDNLWIDVDHEITVMMLPAHAHAYQEWLRSGGLHLFKIPESFVYAVGVREETVTRAGASLAPWTPEQVETLQRFQDGGWMHPFTCGRRIAHPDDSGVLVATVDGWRCPFDACSYVQYWAHAFMVDKEFVDTAEHRHRTMLASWAQPQEQQDE